MSTLARFAALIERLRALTEADAKLARLMDAAVRDIPLPPHPAW